MPDPWLEAEYNNRAKVPDHKGIMDGWQQDATAFRAARPGAEYDIPYGPSARQVLDIFWPSEARDAPLAVFIHGGYWQALDKSWFSHLAHGFVENGLGLAVTSYDLCPNVSMAEIVAETNAACAFLAKRVGRPIYATGHSAGGHLTAMALVADARIHALPDGFVAGGCAISGLFDLVPLVETSINGALGLDVDTAKALSPVAMPAPGRKIHAIVGAMEGDEYFRQSSDIAAAWDGSWESLAGANHFTAIAPLADPSSAMMGFIRSEMLHMPPRFES